MQNKKYVSGSQNGFTLIEILVVIGLIAVLAAIVLIAINPARQFAQGRNAERRSEINTILNAIGQNIADNQGNAPALTGVDADAATFEAINDTALNDAFCTTLVPTYISAMPVDPNQAAEQYTEAECTAGNWDTGYLINRDAAGRITIRAVGEIGAGNLDVTR